mgnify:CR=1 FL=1
MGPSIYYVSIMSDFFWPTDQLYVSMKTVMIVSKFFRPTHTVFVDVIYGWSLRIERKSRMKINRQEPFIVRTTTVVWWWCTNLRYMSIALLRIACKSVSYGNDIARESESSELGFDLLFFTLS